MACERNSVTRSTESLRQTRKTLSSEIIRLILNQAVTVLSLLCAIR